MNSPLKWHGGKHYLATKIAALMPPHLHYVEPYAGGLSVLLAKDPEGVSEVANDLDRDLSNFWRVLQCPERFPQFVRICQATPFSQVEFLRAGSCLDVATDDVWRAWGLFVEARQSLAGRRDTFSPLTRKRVRRGMNAEASAWLSAVEGLPAVHERLKRVVVIYADALHVIRQQDGTGTLFYLDPPYMGDTRASPSVYAYEASEEHHLKLLGLLPACSGKWLLSGYRNDTYDVWAKQYGYCRHDFDLPNHAAGGGGKRRMAESVWCNF